MTMRVGLIGSGMVGKVHLQALASHPYVSRIDLVDTDLASAKALAGEYPIHYRGTEYRCLIEDPDLDILDICLPHDLHYPVAMEAFAAGKHVILEKPIALTLPEADEMISAAERSGRRLFIALNERFLPPYQKVKQILESGDIGRIVMADLVVAGTELARMNLPGHWKGTLGRAGGGALADSGTHVVDLAIHWFGMPESVQCSIGRFVVVPANKGEDTACLVMQYPGKLVNIQVTYAVDGQDWSETRSIWGERGSIHTKIEAANPLEYFLDHHLVAVELIHNPRLWWIDSVKAGIQHAVDCIHSDTPFLVTPRDARNALKVIRYAYASAALHRTVYLCESESVA